jgi:hypothetical protein
VIFKAAVFDVSVPQAPPKNSWPAVPKPALRPVVPAYPACYRFPRSAGRGSPRSESKGFPTAESSRNHDRRTSTRIAQNEARVTPERQSPLPSPASSALLSELCVSALSFGLSRNFYLSTVYPEASRGVDLILPLNLLFSLSSVPSVPLPARCGGWRILFLSRPAPLFSSRYKSLFQRPLSFHIHTKPPGVWGASRFQPSTVDCGPPRKSFKMCSYLAHYP